MFSDRIVAGEYVEVLAFVNGTVHPLGWLNDDQLQELIAELKNDIDSLEYALLIIQQNKK